MSLSIPLQESGVLSVQCVLKCSALLQPKHATEFTPYAEKEGTAACPGRLSSRVQISATFPEGFRPFPY